MLTLPCCCELLGLFGALFCCMWPLDGVVAVGGACTAGCEE